MEKSIPINYWMMPTGSSCTMRTTSLTKLIYWMPTDFLKTMFPWFMWNWTLSKKFFCELCWWNGFNWYWLSYKVPCAEHCWGTMYVWCYRSKTLTWLSPKFYQFLFSTIFNVPFYLLLKAMLKFTPMKMLDFWVKKQITLNWTGILFGKIIENLFLLHSLRIYNIALGNV